MVIHNARAQQKWLTFLTGVFFDLSFIIILLIGEFKTKREIIVMLSVIVCTLLLTFVVYFLLVKFANSVFIFDETGFIRKINKKVVLEVKWEDVINIGTYQIYDFLKFDIGPTFLGIEYYDENHNQQSLNVAFSSKDARKLKAANLNKKLDNIT